MIETSLTDRVRAAHADAWQVHGAIRAGVAELPGVRLMASGLPFAQWNSGDVHDVSVASPADMIDWYAALGVPWGLRVPAGARWPHGRFLFYKRCMGLRPEAFAPAPEVPGLTIRPTRPEDLDTAAVIDAVAFGDSVAATRAWMAPEVTSPRCRPLLAELDGIPVGVVTAIRSSGWAGEAVGIFGVGVLAEYRRRGIGAALTGAACAWGFETGATLAHLNPDTENAGRLYTRLGFTETGGFDIYIDLA
ncbi:GNAT family N-acetyltransferase [Rhizomonospora bruguierae]|uniref:GNAT family N-acetyltransferase n=1 Tax=Rhizomonospora bruguierae TaxID=1581705 RepID=UPI001BCBDEB2|nr:GNAT family N-acetyltransferase [Micromonospora sp. NBRC 107566]